MPVIESMTEAEPADLTAGSDLLYLRKPAAPSGSRDRKFAITAALKSFLNLAFEADKLPYGDDDGSLALTDFTTFARTLLDDEDAPDARATLGFLSAVGTLNFNSINAAASEDLTISVTGASVGDSVHLGLPAAPAAGIIFQGFVSAANTVTVRATNVTGSPVNPASADYRVVVIKSA